MKLRTLTVAIVSVLMLSACSQDEKEAVVAQPLYVSTTAIDAPVKNQFRVFKGQVVPAEQTPIAFRTTGEIREVFVKSGDKVVRGQPIAQLDDSSVQQAFNDAKAQYSLASKQLSRSKDLFERSMISEAELDELNANRQLAKAQYELAKNQLKYTQLNAPFSGTISDVFKERFERVQAGESVVDMYQDDKVYVQIELSDNVLAMITPDGRSVQYRPMVTFSGVEGQHQMNYLEHTNEPSQQTGSYSMWLERDQLEQPILPGTTATVAVDMVEAGITAVDGYQVPMTALQAGDNKGRFFVWKLNGNQVNRVEVAVSQVNGDGAIIASGVVEGDILINSSLRKLREGKAVETAEKNNG
ncbi:efflux RND transporter periplasmic adaptor subunit [Enterovibrio calviensis]|uniref:efflux RND transporter periplasmic adaptor subunit n=1 Tax=Enterovibrio calviensis TaxID=91359 RepID=UPI000484C738|nr:efflux RND transporter periplasmic adaptor subunit [Enterovibrio calviensis]